MNESEGVVPMLTDSSIILIEEDSEITSLEPINPCIQEDSTTLYQLADDALSNSPVYLFASLPTQNVVDVTGSPTQTDADMLYNDPVQVQVIRSSPENQLSNRPMEIQQFFTNASPVSSPTKLFDLKELSHDETEDVVQCYVVGAGQGQDQNIEAVSPTTVDKQQEIIILTDAIDDDEQLCNLSKATDVIETTENPMSNEEKIKDSTQTSLSLDPPLLMTCEVLQEFTAGSTSRREVMTQTMPPKKLRVQKKRKVNEDETSINGSELIYRCPHCSLRFTIPEKLRMHINCHVPDSFDYHCFKCDFTCPQWIKMYNHLFTHGIEKPHKCSQCAFTCINKFILASHMAVHNQSKDWTCEKCNRQFKHRRNMVAHLRTCNGLDEDGKPKLSTEKHVCSVCDRKLSNYKNLQKHMEIHSNIKPYVCDVCGHSTRLKESLVMHKRLHTGEKPFQCNLCEYATPDKSSLRRHKKQHTNEKPYSCSICNYKCIQKHCLDTHIRRKHTGERFVCGVCHYATHSRYTLNQHFKKLGQMHALRPELTSVGQSSDEEKSSFVAANASLTSHSDEIEKEIIPDKIAAKTNGSDGAILTFNEGGKPLQCNNLCVYTLSEQPSLQIHKRQHTHVKPYSCSMCNYKCVQKHCLDTHIRRKHTGERFVCGVCHYATNSRDTLNQHFKKHEQMYALPPELTDPGQNSDEEKSSFVAANTSLTSQSHSDEIEKEIIPDKIDTETNENEEVVLTLNEVPGTETSGMVLQPSELSMDNITAKVQNSKFDLTLTESVLQEINQPGDQMFMQANGDIVLQRSDGRILILQLQDEAEENLNIANIKE